MYAYLVGDDERFGVVKKALMALALLAMMGIAMAVVASPAWADTNITVNSLDDDIDGTDGNCTLREAITSANTDLATEAGTGECAAGSGADTITFAIPGEGPHTITLSNTLPYITDGDGLIIDGEQNQITVSGNDEWRVLNVDSGARLDLKNLTVANGRESTGGGIYNDHGTVNVSNSTFSQNSATGAGGGILNNHGTVNVSNSTFSGNSAVISGGGIYSSTNDSQTTTIENSTISGNSAGRYGGGVFNSSGLTTINSTTITNNKAPDNQGAGVASTEDTGTSSTVVGNSIIAANSSTDVDFVFQSTNSFTSEGYNLIGNGNATSAFDKTGDQASVTDPGLDSLADNGGPTKTHALLADSPAIDEGNTALSKDQRGVARPQGDADDIGSFELEQQNAAPEITVLAGSASRSACLSNTTGRITLELSDANNDPLTLSATSSNTRLVPNSNVSFGGTGETRTATISTVSGRTGTSTVEITVSDDQTSTTTTVTVKAGGNGRDTLSGTEGADLLLGQNGDDTLSGLGEDDVLCGSNGNDRLSGGAGSDTLDGGSGTDITDYKAGDGDSKTNIP